MRTIKVGSDFSGVGAFNQALMRLGIAHEEIFACDMDKYARQTFIHNYGEPKYYPENVYDREIPEESLDIYMTSPPCQAFSLAGKRLGKDDKRGILFFNSHEFIQKNKPRYFIFENVKGLLSDDNGKTFQEWVNMLGGKSVNGVPIIFPYEDSVPYHLYWKVLNAKNHGVPQNRERVFLIGIRDDSDNTFSWPKEIRLTKKLKDVLEDEIFEKYFLSPKAVEKCVKSQANAKLLENDLPDQSRCIVAGYGKIPFDGQYLKVKSNLEKYYLSDKMLEQLTFEKKGNYEVANINKGGQMGIVEDVNAPAISCLTAVDYKNPKKIIQVKSGTNKGFEEAQEGDSVNLGFPSSDSRRGRVGKGVAQTLDTGCQQGVILPLFQYAPGSRDGRWVFDKNGISPCMVSDMGTGGGNISAIQIGDFRTDEGFRWREDGTSPCIMASMRDKWSEKFTAQNPPIVKFGNKRLNETLEKNDLPPGEVRYIDSYNKSVYENALTITTRVNDSNLNHLWDGFRIRRLTPRECFRLMDFPDTFSWPVSDSQAYKQAGNSIVVAVLEKIISKFNLD
jgi:DNA (cytosine-5)-methyltransferase 1